jgi:hypothetical protein
LLAFSHDNRIKEMSQLTLAVLSASCV